MEVLKLGRIFGFFKMNSKESKKNKVTSDE